MRKLNFYPILLLFLLSASSRAQNNLTLSHGAIVRGDTTTKTMSLVFTGHKFGEGGWHILHTLDEHKVKASFFFTGAFYTQPKFESLITNLKDKGHYLGAHSDRHLLYCDWEYRDSLLVTRSEFLKDLRANYVRMKAFGIQKSDAIYFLPPYEWYNDSISQWTSEENLQLINITYGTKTHADYTLEGDPNFISSIEIYRSVWDYESNENNGLNGFILLIHIGSGPMRKDKFYLLLGDLIDELKGRGYDLVPIDELLK